MLSEYPPTHRHVSTSRAVRHHPFVVILCVALGALAGWFYAASMSTTYTSTARVLVNPSVGNPYAPTPSSVRQDELTSLETEAQVVRSAEVLGTVADQSSALTTRALERGLAVTVPPNTQVLHIAYTAGDPVVAQQVADAVAEAYLANRDRRFREVNAARIERVETRTLSVVQDLRAATEAAQKGSAAERLFQTELADALRNELVNLRAQRTALENSESPAGAVISPASTPGGGDGVLAMAIPVGGAVAGLALGCLLALLLERALGVIRSARDVEEIGLPVFAAVPPPGWRARLLRGGGAEAFDTTIRRLRATILDLEPRPEIIAVAPAGAVKSEADVTEALAQSFAKAGHSVVLVKTDRHPVASGLGMEERGLAQALTHERLNVLDLLVSSVDPLLSVLPDGRFTARTRELLVADRLRDVLAPLIGAGHLVIIQSPGIDSAEGEAIVGAADLGLVVVTVGRTRPAAVEQVTRQERTREADLAAFVVGPRDAARQARRPVGSDLDDDSADEEALTHGPLSHTPR